MLQENPEKLSIEHMYGLDPEMAEQRLKAEQLLKELIISEAVVTLVAVDDVPDSVKIKHKRDVADDADIYTREVNKPQENEVGWMLPLDVDGRAGFVIITPDFTTSIHFIKSNDRGIFEGMRDNFSPGKSRFVHDRNRIHTDGVNFHFEDMTARLIPTNPDHQDQIKEYMGIALNQARERVVKGIEAQNNNRTNTLQTFGNFLDELRGDTNPVSPQE